MERDKQLDFYRGLSMIYVVCFIHVVYWLKIGAKLTPAMEQIPLLPTKVRIYLDYKALGRNVPTTFIQDILLKKGVLK